ncbi:MOSC domain-containing protein [Paenibacillus sp. TRM 82003]|nr:MOSC domain-containing protein [Paenibacillus sp. TRM 82003]
MQLSIVSVNVSVPQTIVYKGKNVSTAIAKRPVEGVVAFGDTSLDGDEQGDKVHHGGPDKAICVYFAVHYPHWETVLGHALPPGAFGENFTVDGALEDDVRIGDTFRIGDALLQVSQPRVPCFKLSAIHERPTLEREVKESGFTGFYFRVLRPGSVAAGDKLTLEAADLAGITVAEANRVMHRDPGDLDALRRLLAVEALADSWRSQLQKRLK